MGTREELEAIERNTIKRGEKLFPDWTHAEFTGDFQAALAKTFDHTIEVMRKREQLRQDCAKWYKEIMENGQSKCKNNQK